MMWPTWWCCLFFLKFMSWESYMLSQLTHGSLSGRTFVPTIFRWFDFYFNSLKWPTTGLIAGDITSRQPMSHPPSPPFAPGGGGAPGNSSCPFKFYGASAAQHAAAAKRKEDCQKLLDGRNKKVPKIPTRHDIWYQQPVPWEIVQ